MSDNYVQILSNTNTGGNTVAVTLTGVTALNTIVAFGLNGGGTTITGVSDAQGAYTAKGPQVNDSSDSVAGQAFVLQNANSGSHAATLTVTGTGFCFLALVEVGTTGGASAYADAQGQLQSAPAGTADALTSTALTIGAAVTLVGFCTDGSSSLGVSVPAAGTGFTSRESNGNAAIGAYRIETAGVSTNSAATFTKNAGAAGGDNYVTLGVAILNSAGASAIDEDAEWVQFVQNFVHQRPQSRIPRYRRRFRRVGSVLKPERKIWTA